MKEKESLRRANRALSARETGLPPGQSRLWSSDLLVSGRESAALRLPVIPSEAPIQDPETGEFSFMLDFSALDGPDPLA